MTLSNEKETIRQTAEQEKREAILAAMEEQNKKSLSGFFDPIQMLGFVMVSFVVVLAVIAVGIVANQ